MWLKLTYKDLKSELFKPDTIKVSVVDSVSVPINSEDQLVRTSKIFPLIQENKDTIALNNLEIHFYDFKNPFQILGKINQSGSPELKSKTYFSYGACSVIIFLDKNELIDEFTKFNFQNCNGFEKWVITNGLIHDIDPQNNDINTETILNINNYDRLPLVIRAMLDESVASLLILKDKEKNQGNTDIISGFLSIVNQYIQELIYLTFLEGEAPKTMFGKAESYRNPSENRKLQHQIIDRLVQINSSLSYVSTQTLSGSIPILERRSIIRRSSLLGIGSSIRALNRIVRYIERSFASVNFYNCITKAMHSAAPLQGLEAKVYDRKTWYEQNIDTIHAEKDPENVRKLAYFSSRNAFRESEYSITASMNSISSGLSLSWTLLTITHEMLHSHVRMLMSAIFFDSNHSFKDIYDRFIQKYCKKVDVQNYKLIDSLREIILRYCAGTLTFGSISEIKHYDSSKNPCYNVKDEDLELLLQREYRNINEIIVHTLDLHYFYGGRTSKYILLIWHSWSAIPHVGADVRQYLLRSLLAIASKISQQADAFTRFQLSVKEFKDIISDNEDILKDSPLIVKLQTILENDGLLKRDYFGAFKNSIILVDLAMQIFYSQKVSAEIWQDDNVIMQDTNSTETDFRYNLPLEFMDVEVVCPIPYLFDRMIRVLKGEIPEDDIERQTTMSFLAMN